MATKFRGPDVWREISEAIRGSKMPSHVAVAYLGQGASRLLPLARDSRLVVNASESSVRSGQTCPDELAKLQARGVRVFSVQNLHAKVFVVGSEVFVGSANASRRSSSTLVEAMVQSSDRAVVTEAHRFVNGLCLHELGPEALSRLAKIYRPPRVPGGDATRLRTSGRSTHPSLPRVWLAQLVEAVFPEWTKEAFEQGQRAAKVRMDKPKRHAIDVFSWNRSPPFRPGDVVLQVLKQDDGRRMASPPGTVLHIEKWKRSGSQRVFVYIEVPVKRRVQIERLARRMGPGALKRLKRGGEASAEFSTRLLDAWGDSSRA